MSQCQRWRVAGRRIGLADGTRKVRRLDRLAAGEEDRSFDDIAKLAHVPWPRVTLQERQRLRGNRHGRATGAGRRVRQKRFVIR
jgi:hypothetical protein